MCTKCESMSAAIASLTKEIERLQKELIAREEQLQQTQETGDYYKKNCETLENELAKLTEEQEANDARHIEAYTILEEESENLRAEIEALQKQLAEKPHKDASNYEALSNKNNTRKNNYNDYKNRATMTDRRTHSNCCTMTDPVAIVMPDVMEDMQRRLTKELINCGTMTDIRSHSNCCTMTDPVAIVMPDVMEDMQRRLTKELINCGTMTDGTISTNRATMTDRRTHSNCCIMTDPVAIVMPDVMEDMQRRLTKELINCGTMTDGTISTNRATMTDRRTHSNCCIMTDPVAIVMPDVMEDMQRRLTKELINCGTMTDGTISTNRATMTDRRTHSNCCIMTDPVAIVMPDVMEDMQRRLTKELINCGTMTDGTISTNRATMTDRRTHSNCGAMTDPVAIVMPDVMEYMPRRLTKELINCGTMTDIRSHSNCCTMTDPVAIVMPDVMEDMQRRLTKELINCGTMTDIRSHSNCCTMTDPVAIVMPDVMEDMQRRLTKELINCGTMTDIRSHSNCCTMTDPVAIVMPDVMEDMQRRLTKELINCGTMTDIRSHSNCCTMTDPVAIVMPDVMEDMQRRLTKELINCGTMTDGTVSTNRATMTDRRTHSNCCTMTDPVAIVMPDVMEDMQRRLTKELINCGTMTDIRSHSNCCTMTDPVAIVMPDVMEDMQRRLTKELINCGTMTDGTVSTNRATMTDRRTHSNCCTMTDPVAIVMPDVMEDMQRRLTKELINCGTMTDIRSHSNCCTMTDPVAIVMPDVMEDMQRRLTKELINCGTMTDGTVSTNRATMTDRRTHSNCCTMTDPVAIVMPDVMEDMQRRLTKELINCGTMTDIRSHSNCCTMTDPVAIVMPDVMEDMQRRLTKELINCGTMTDIRSHSNCCTMTDPVAIVMPDVMEDMQRRLTKELINCGTMTDGTISTNRATMTDRRTHSNCCTMTDPVAIVMPDVMEDMQRRLTKELINCGTMTDIRSHSNCCTMTDPVAIVMPDVMEDMQRRLTKELINCGTMTDIRSHSNCCTMTDPVAIVMPDVMEDMQRRLTKELINCGTMTDIRSHSNCCTMTDPVAIVMPDVMEDMQRRLTKELINCGTMTDIRSHSNCCIMTDPVAIVMPDVMEDMQRRLTKELINCGTMTDGTVSTNRATMTEVCRQSNSLDRRVSCVSGTAENVSLSGETFCRNTSVNTRECSYIARNTIFASSVVSSFVPVIGEGQFEWWCLDDVYAHALLFSYCNPRDVGINIGLFDDCDDKVLLQSLGVVHRTLGSIRADYDGSVVSVIRRFLVQQRGALAGDGALEGCVPCEALFEVLISARNALLVEPMVSNSSTVKGEDRVCHGDGEGALDSCVYAHLQVAMTAVFSIARERGGYLSDIFASVKVQKALEAMRQFFTSSNLFSSGSSSVSSTSEANGDSSSFLEDMLRETEVPRFVLGGALQRAAAVLKDDVVTKLQRRRLCGGLSLEEALLACYLAEERITALTEIENLREEMVQPVTREALDLIDGAVRAFLKSEESEDFSAEATNHMKSSSFTTALAFLFTYVAAQTATETVGLPQDSPEHVRDALNVVAQTLLRRSVSQTSRFDVAQSNTAIDPESMQQSLRIIMDYAESQGYYPVTCDTSDACSRSNHHCQYSQQTRRKDTPDIDVTKREALMEKMDSPRTTPRSSPHPRLSSPQEQRPQTSVVVVSQPNVTSHHINDLVHRGRMTDPVAIVMPDVMEDMQRRLTKELINCGTMTDGTISTNRATMTDRRTHSNCCTMTDPVAIVMPDVMEDMQRRLTKELINCGTMTDIRSHSNCCTMTDPVAIVMPDVMEDMQRRLTKELINCGTMTDIRSHSNCCTMTDPVAIVMPDVMEDMQRRLTKELINCGTMTDIRSHSNCCTMTDPVAIVMPDVMEDMQRRLTKELINCGTMTDIRSHSNCCTMTDPVAIVMPDVMEDVQRRPSNRLDASTSLKVSENNGDVAVYEAVRFGDEKVVVDSCSVASVSDSFPRDLSSEVGKLQLRVLDLGKEVYMLQKELMAREEQLQKTQERADYYKKNCETLENELAKLTEEQEANDARHIEAYTILEEESENLRAEIEALQKQLAEKPHKDASNSEALSNKNYTGKTDSDHAVDGKENLGLHHVSSVRSLVHLKENKAREHLRSRSWSNGREPPGGVLPTGLRTWPQTAQQSAPAACTHEKGVERKLSEELDESDVVNHLTAQATPEMLNLKPELFVKNPASFDRLVSYLTRLVERAEREPGALSCEERHLSEVLKVFSTFYCGYRSIESGTGTCPIVDGNLRSRGGSSHSLLRRAKGMWSPESLRVSPDVGRSVDAVKEDQNGKHLGPVPSASTTFRTGRSERCTSSVRGVALVGGLLASRRRSSTAPSPTEGPRVPLPREEIEDLEGMSELVSSIEDMQSQLAYFSFSNEPELRESIKQLQQHLEELRAVLESQMSTKMSQSPSYISSFRGSCFSQGNQQGQGVQEGKPPLKAESNGCQPATDSACDTNYSNGGQTDYLAVCNAVNTCCGGRGAFHRGSNRCSHWVPLRMHRANHDENVGLAMNEPGGSIPQGRSNAFDDGSQRKCMAPNRRNQSAVMRRLLDSMRFDLDSYVYTAAEQNAASAALLEESSSLKEREADMWLRLNQTEFCEMARIEMRLKRDDLRELQHEIHRMHLLHDKELVERKRRLLIYSYRKLLDFAKRMSDILKAREFCTGTLESQRLLLLDETSDFTKDVEKYIEVL
ncbi:kinesin, putative [Trypanosoma brucei gambiense DAL972]|uniref:Kinesin, putative n=1 Tax=Trypanosoma brucei gambiense (strain MHOM/CI/86/DAL972) TaxID=679716 RepID=D0A175_TRYB9|nr:kinesin, putative [Trypanosoma brucei gambiense DAL972]CBH15017.1 kinesin, putative [Trypanosoma brucei gambiense DAL972]|eukprot:XP_011777283.1 kinesin, putative [Trypanosoma brucei gambiense DAL972]